MASLEPDLVKRVGRLPKPTNVAGALQPLFEAISNSIHSTQALYGERAAEQGRIVVSVSTNRQKEGVRAAVEDNGTGLDTENWEAFTTTDTGNKIETGGKGVGRLLWLDCFESILISSVFREGGTLMRRKFEFLLSRENQIRAEEVVEAPDAAGTMFRVAFEGLRHNGYLDKFPGRPNYVFQHFTSHFLPVLISGRSPSIAVSVGGEERLYPEAIREIVHRSENGIALETDCYGTLHLTLMECDKVASADLKGSHFIHFIAHDRTVHSQSIDRKLGLRCFGPKDDRVFHAILSGDFLDNHVNQERTAFIPDDAFIDQIINEICAPHVDRFLDQPLRELKAQQCEIIEDIAATYPSVAFGDSEELQRKVPSGELKGDAIYGHLSRERYRRDEKQAKKIREALLRLKDPSADVSALAEVIPEASKALEEAEQRSLAEYVVRRKVVLDLIGILLEKVRDGDGSGSYQREEILHSFICPVRVNNVSGDEARRIEASASHNLWVVDERLTFAEYFCSDVDFKTLSDDFDSAEHADVLIFDYVHGLRHQQNGGSSSKVLLVEFKRPGQEHYLADGNPQMQVQRYVKRLQSGGLKDLRGRPIDLDENSIFYCYIVADIIGRLDEWTFSWQKTPDGRRIYRPESGFRGSIEIIGWDALIEDARARNKAFFDRAGITGKSLFDVT